MLKTQKVDVTLRGMEQIDAIDFYERMSKIFSKRVSTLSFLTYAALFLGHHYWEPIKRVKQQFMMP